MIIVVLFVLKADCEQPMHIRFLPESDEDWRLYGHCNRSIPMYSYNVTSQNCEDQMAFGCPANANSFNSYYTCMRFCRTLPPVSTQAQPTPDPEVCIRPSTLSTQCDNFETHHYKYYFNGSGCSPFNGTLFLFLLFSFLSFPNLILCTFSFFFFFFCCAIFEIEL